MINEPNFDDFDDAPELSDDDQEFHNELMDDLFNLMGSK